MVGDILFSAMWAILIVLVITWLLLARANRTRNNVWDQRKR